MLNFSININHIEHLINSLFEQEHLSQHISTLKFKYIYHLIG